MNNEQLLQEYAKANCSEFETLSKADKSRLLHELRTSAGFSFYRASKAFENFGKILEQNFGLTQRVKK